MLADSFILERLNKVGNAFPIVAPEDAVMPYSIYKSRIHVNYNSKNYVNSYEIYVEVNLYSKTYDECYRLVQEVINSFRSKGKFIVRINDIDIQYNQNKIYQGIIYLDITVNQ